MYKFEQLIPVEPSRHDRVQAALFNPSQHPAPYTESHPIPAHAVIAEIPRIFEESLWQRGLLTLPPSCTPFWFIVETERNVALWRRGFSLIAVDEFDFLVDVPAMIEKREQQLAEADESNPFHLAPLAPGRSASEVWEKECRYLCQFAELWAAGQTHLAAMSSAVQLLRNDLSAEPKLSSIVLPDSTCRRPSEP